MKHVIVGNRVAAFMYGTQDPNNGAFAEYVSNLYKSECELNPRLPMKIHTLQCIVCMETSRRNDLRWSCFVSNTLFHCRPKSVFPPRSSLSIRRQPKQLFDWERLSFHFYRRLTTYAALDSHLGWLNSCWSSRHPTCASFGISRHHDGFRKESRVLEINRCRCDDWL